MAKTKTVDPPMTAEQKMNQVRTNFVLDHPFFATVLCNLEIRKATEEDEALLWPPGAKKTMCTDGRRILWSEQYVNEITLAQAEGVVCHELLHVICMHMLRRGERDPIIWNIATDFVVNLMTRESKFELPEGLLENRTYDGMDPETIFNHLIKLNKQNMKQLIDQMLKSGAGWVMDMKNPDGSEMTKADKKQAELEQKAVNETARIQHQKLCGDMPGAMKRFLDNLKDPKINWREYLSQFVEVNSKSDYNFSKPNRRYVGQEVFLPQIYSPEIGHVVNLIDASGSISHDELLEETSELKGILWAYEGVVLSVIFFDTRASEPVEITDDTEISKLKVEAGGGTDYKPAFDKVEKSNLEPVCCIVLTDGYCSSFPKEPEYPVLWILTGQRNDKFKPPFGEVVKMELLDEK